MTTLNIAFDVNNQPRFPVYRKYADQHMPQPAYILLDIQHGTCGADYNGAIGSVPSDQHNNTVITFPISATATAENIAVIINDHKTNFQAILDDSSVEWDGSNRVGVFGDTAKDILTELGFYEGGNPDGLQYAEHQNTLIDENSFADWLADSIQDCDDIEAFAKTLHELDGENGQYFIDSLNNPDAILAQLKEAWAQRLYSGNDVPAQVAQYLLSEGTCDDSQWVEELSIFANNP